MTSASASAETRSYSAKQLVQALRPQYELTPSMDVNACAQLIAKYTKTATRAMAKRVLQG